VLRRAAPSTQGRVRLDGRNEKLAPDHRASVKVVPAGAVAQCIELDVACCIAGENQATACVEQQREPQHTWLEEGLLIVEVVFMVCSAIVDD